MGRKRGIICGLSLPPSLPSFLLLHIISNTLRYYSLSLPPPLLLRPPRPLAIATQLAVRPRQGYAMQFSFLNSMKDGIPRGSTPTRHKIGLKIKDEEKLKLFNLFLREKIAWEHYGGDQDF